MKMMKTRKLGIMFIAAVLLVALAFAGAVSAAENGGSCGGGLTWSVNNNVLTITLDSTYEGEDKGKMTDFADAADVPWKDNKGTITSVVLPDGLKNIGKLSFYSCTNLKSIDIPASVTGIGISAFANAGLTSIAIPASVTSIGRYAFYECPDLTEITFEPGSKLKTIDDAAFAYSGLTSIKIPANVEIIGEDEAGMEGLFACCGALTNVTFAEDSKLKRICAYTFCDCEALTSIDIPASVTTIGPTAFSGCSALTEVTFADVSKLTKIGDNAFMMCSALTSIEIPASVTSIGGYTFYGCSALTSIEIPASVTSIGGYAFSGCSALTSIAIPASVTSIGDNAFFNCDALTNVTFADVSNLATIGKKAFGTTGLKKVIIKKGTFPTTATFGSKVFESCGDFNVVISDKLQTPEIMDKFTVPPPEHLVANQGSTNAGDDPVWYISELTSLPTEYDPYYIGLLNGGNLNADFVQQTDSNDDYILPTGDDVTRTGYTFDKWVDDAGNEVTTLTDSVKHAKVQWTSQGNIKLTLNPRGGNGIITTYAVSKDQAMVIPNPGFYRTGFSQNGWSDDPEDTTVKYQVGETITPTDNMTLYAVWGQGGTTNVTLYNEPTFTFFVPSDVILSNEASGLVGTNVSIVPGHVKDAGKDIVMRVNTTAEKQYSSQPMFSTFSLTKFGSGDKALYSLYVYADKDAFYEKEATKQVTGSQHSTGGYTDANNIVIGSRGAAESPAVSALLGFKTDKLPSVAGVYNGQLTFTVGVESPVPV